MKRLYITLVLIILLIGIVIVSLIARSKTMALTMNCPQCGEAMKHDYLAPTCEADGYDNWTCLSCDYYKWTTLAQVSHSGTKYNCIDGSWCIYCKKLMSPAVATGHAWKEATCTTPKTCTRAACGVTEGEALKHDWADADCTHPRTCKRTGCGATQGIANGHVSLGATCLRQDTCRTCGTVLGPALGHNEVTDPAVAATCKSTGKTAGSHCSRCSTVIKAQTIIPKKDHTPGAEATCTTPQKCTVCQTVIKEALDHDPVTDPAVEATCTTTGKTAGSHCGVCYTVLSAQRTIPATGHTPGANATCTTPQKCTVCQTVLASATGHDWSTTPSNYINPTPNGHTPVYKCKNCTETKNGDEEKHSIPTWKDNGNGTHSGTCTPCGYVATQSHNYSGNTCTDCGATKTTECQHNWVTKSNPTSHWQECSKCNVTKDEEAHKVTTWADNGNGTHSGTCACGYVVTQSHNYSGNTCECGATKTTECQHNWVTKSGSTSHWQECSKCNVTKNEEAHKVTTWTDNGNGTHSGTCTSCQYVVTENHTNGINGNCDKCKYTANNNTNNGTNSGTNSGTNNNTNNGTNSGTNNNTNNGTNSGTNNNTNNGTNNNTNNGTNSGTNNSTNTNSSGKNLPNTGKKTTIITIIGVATLLGTSIIGIKKYKNII